MGWCPLTATVQVVNPIVYANSVRVYTGTLALRRQGALTKACRAQAPLSGPPLTPLILGFGCLALSSL